MPEKLRKNRVYETVSLIPKGKVLTYGALAGICGINNPRSVGFWLHRNPDPVLIPCHRVVNSHGKTSSRYAFGGRSAQVRKLRSDGLVVSRGSVDLKRYFWTGSIKLFPGSKYVRLVKRITRGTE